MDIQRKFPIYQQAVCSRVKLEPTCDEFKVLSTLIVCERLSAFYQEKEKMTLWVHLRNIHGHTKLEMFQRLYTHTHENMHHFVLYGHCGMEENRFHWIKRERKQKTHADIVCKGKIASDVCEISAVGPSFIKLHLRPKRHQCEDNNVNHWR